MSKRPIRKAYLTVLLWNVYVGQKPADVLEELTEFAREHRPLVIVLAEATRAFGVLDDVPGYRRLQVRPNGARGRKVNEDGNTAILVRRGVAVKAHRPVRMDRTWVGPKHGLPHEPRVYHAATVKTGGVRWRILGDHLPTGGVKGRRNGAAVRESLREIRAWLRAYRLPSIAVGDKNLSKRTVRDQLDTRVAGVGIDLAAYRNCELVSVENLGKNGSDHPAVLFKFSKVR